MVSNHSAFQVAGNPYEPRPPMKFHNYWTVRTAPGWSSLFVPALNRPNGVVELLSGVVDTDAFETPVNFPFVATAPDGVHVLAEGHAVGAGDPVPARRCGDPRRGPRRDGRRERPPRPHPPEHHGRRQLVPPPRPGEALNDDRTTTGPPPGPVVADGTRRCGRPPRFGRHPRCRPTTDAMRRPR